MRALAGYNNLEVAEYLLEHGADVNAQDKGGLIPLHNAASYGVRNATAALNTCYSTFLLFHSALTLSHSAACGHRCSADQVQHVCERDG